MDHSNIITTSVDVGQHAAHEALVKLVSLCGNLRGPERPIALAIAAALVVYKCESMKEIRGGTPSSHAFGSIYDATLKSLREDPKQRELLDRLSKAEGQGLRDLAKEYGVDLGGLG
jgi:hypothetical protein